MIVSSNTESVLRFIRSVLAVFEASFAEQIPTSPNVLIRLCRRISGRSCSELAAATNFANSIRTFVCGDGPDECSDECSDDCRSDECSDDCRSDGSDSETFGDVSDVSSTMLLLLWLF